MSNSNKPRPYTPEEVRDNLVAHAWSLVEYWNSVENRDQRGRLSGLAFSIFSMLDGASELPMFLVTPAPHESDSEYHQDQGENWYPEDKPDLGELHSVFAHSDPKADRD